MTVEAEIVTRLTGHSGLSALIGSRVYWELAPETPTQPYVTFTRIGTVRESAMVADSGIASARFQFDCWGGDQTSVRDVRNQLRKALQRWSTTSGTIVQETFIEDERDFALERDTHPVLHRAGLDALVHYEED